MTASDYAFVRTRDPKMDKDAPEGHTLWQFWGGPGDVEEGWLAPADVIQLGLVDTMREGVNAQLSAQAAAPIHRRPAAMPETPTGATGKPTDATEDPNRGSNPNKPIEVQGGRTEAFRWERVEDGDQTFWAIDNKPAIKKAIEEGEIPPEFQHLVVPETILQMIVGA